MIWVTLGPYMLMQKIIESLNWFKSDAKIQISESIDQNQFFESKKVDQLIQIRFRFKTRESIDSNLVQSNPNLNY